MHEFEEMEDAVIAKLNTPLETEGVRTLETYNGQLDVEEIEDMIRRFPCVYVLAGPLDLKDRNRYLDYRMQTTLLVGDKNIRGSSAAARGDTSSVGIYRLLEVIRQNLHNQKLVRGWSTLIVTSENPMIYSPENNICLYTATYESKAVKS